jgi:hypothetical protein
MLTTNDKSLLLKLISLFSNNREKVRLSEETMEIPKQGWLPWGNMQEFDTQCMSLIIFKTMNDDALKDFIYAYEIVVLFTSHEIFIEVMEKIFNGRGQSGEDWPIVGSPISLALGDIDPAEFILAAEFRALYKSLKDVEELEKEKKSKDIVQLFLDDALTFENPLEKLFDMMEKKQKSEALNTVRNEPKVMDFSGASKGTDDDSGDSD